MVQRKIKITQKISGKKKKKKGPRTEEYRAVFSTSALTSL